MCQVEFEMACAAIKQLKGPVSDQEKLLVYSYYKQATQGDCNIPAPPATDLKAKAKWEAWNENKGMSKMDAMRIYIAKVEELKKNEAAHDIRPAPVHGGLFNNRSNNHKEDFKGNQQAVRASSHEAGLTGAGQKSPTLAACDVCG
ncbi:hypothetical protein E5288_WYG020699 [Bos mutus]|uniref:Diazepam-binding inhibitor-like 5 n=1 Tax=Bos mutus TaxID=72004 RepID=A0A6B0R9S8_9CETA|nr:hypothetical protein [Bos mutus]